MCAALSKIAIGGLWALATATIMRLVPASAVPEALGVLYTGHDVLPTRAVISVPALSRRRRGPCPCPGHLPLVARA